MRAWALREYRPEDFNFIANSYLKSYRHSPAGPKFLVNDVYYTEYKDRLDHILKHAAIYIACASDDLDHILGYIIVGKVHDWDVLHYAYVKFPFRQLGLAAALIKTVLPNWSQRMTICTHLPKNWSALSQKYKLIFDPKYASQP